MAFEIENDAIADANSWDHDINYIQYKYIIEQAQEFVVPIPKFDPNGGLWENVHGKWRLTRLEQEKLRAVVRVEKKERSEIWNRWMPLSSMFVALLSLAISILTFFLK
jgi:hypothetical protein